MASTDIGIYLKEEPAMKTETALIVSPAHANNFFQMTIREIICKPTARE